MQEIKAKAGRMWNRLNSRAGNRRGDKPSYTNVEVRVSRPDFISWAVQELTEWVKTRPLSDASLDRKNNEGHYELSNLQILSFGENSGKRSNTSVSSKAPCGYQWCRICKDFLPDTEFHGAMVRKNGQRHKRTICKFHHSLYQKEQKLKNLS